MKGLLHSKRFRTNLYKWLCAYVGVLMLLTVVVTYSKYITSMGVSEGARNAYFSAEFSCEDIESSLNNKCITTSSFRPTSPVEYKFKFDTSNTEVNTYLVITITVDEKFELLNVFIDDININEYNVPGTRITNNGSNIKIETNIKAGDGRINHYKVLAKYIESSSNPLFDEDGFKEYVESIDNVVTVEYSAIQVNEVM